MSNEPGSKDWKLLLVLSVCTVVNLGMTGAILYMMSKQCVLSGV